MRRSFGTFVVLVAPLGVLAPAFSASALDHVLFTRDGQERAVSGQLEVKAADGGVMLRAADGVLWSIPPDQQRRVWHDDTPFRPYDADQMTARLLEEFSDGFEVHHTAHFLICHNTSRAMAEWCGALFERLYSAFTNYWQRSGFKLHEPETPLVAVVFANEESYRAYAARELGGATGSIIGYYNLQTNRMALYDLTESQSLRRPTGRRGSAAEINQMLSQPEAERTVATVIHEATHQIAFNCGLQTRFADIPLWVSEGIAVYFETPDLSRGKGWRTIGAVNRVRLANFRDYLARRPEASLESLVADDRRFRDTRQAADAYAEAWALNYFLLRERPKQYRAYLARLSKKGALVWDTPEERLSEFRAAFGDDLTQFDRQFLRQIARIR